MHRFIFHLALGTFCYMHTPYMYFTCFVHINSRRPSGTKNRKNRSGRSAERDRGEDKSDKIKSIENY